MTKSEIRDTVITGSYLIGNEGMKEPAWGWEDYANKLEDMLVKNNGVLPHVSGSVFCSCLTRTAIPKGDKFTCKYCGLEIKN